MKYLLDSFTIDTSSRAYREGYARINWKTAPAAEPADNERHAADEEKS